MPRDPDAPSGDRRGAEAPSAGYDAIWEWELPSGALAWSRGFGTGFGYDPDVLPDLAWWRERVHPEDRQRVDALVDEPPPPGETWETVLRFRRADGDYAEARLDAVPVGGDEPDRLVATMVDLDERGWRGTRAGELDERYRTLVEQNLVGISLAQDDEFVHVNPRLAEIHGSDRETLLGTDPAALVPEGQRDEVLSEVYRLAEGEIDETTFSGPIRRQDGETAYVEAYVRRIEYRGEDAFLAVTVDVTEQVEAQRARETSEELFRAVFENELSGIVIADDEGTYVDANPAACEIFGVERGRLVGGSIEDLDEVVVDSGGLDVDSDDAWEIFRDTGEDHGRFTLVRPDGERRIVEYATTADILPDRHLTVLRDVTDRVGQEAALEEERERLDFLNAMLRHHVLNGMNIVLATAERLAADAEGRREDRLETIRRRGEAIVELVGTIRSLVRTIRTDEVPGFGRVDLTETLRRSVSAATEEHPAATVTVEGAEADRWVYADAMLATVFDDLVENAILHSDAAEPAVLVRVEADEDAVSVHVADEGPGIPEAVREDVFDGEATSGRSGFGLHVVQLLVELYGGSMDIRDRDPRGTVVTVTLPRARPDDE